MSLQQTLILTRIRDCGPPITRNDICDWEREISAKLPDDYVNFLSKCNGGHFYRDGIVFPTPGRSVGDEIGFFVFPGLKTCDSDTDLRELLRLHRGRLPDRTLPIGSTCNDLLLLGLQDGKIYYWERDLEMRVNDPNENQFLVADSFTEFCEGCRYESIEELEDYTLEKEEPFKSIELQQLSRLRRHLDDGFPLYQTNERGQTLLYVASLYLDWDGTIELLERGANPDDGDHATGRPPLWAAASAGAGDLVKLLLSNGASPFMDMDKTRPIVDYIDPPPEDRVRELLANGAGS